jgi:hypothetical protein
VIIAGGLCVGVDVGVWYRYGHAHVQTAVGRDGGGSALGPGRGAVAVNAALSADFMHAAWKSRNTCRSCHARDDALSVGGDVGLATVLAQRASQSREVWAEAVRLKGRCGVCHEVPDPGWLSSPSWSEAIGRMLEVMDQRRVPRPASMEVQDLTHYYYTFSPAELPRLGPDSAIEGSPLTFTRRELRPYGDAKHRGMPIILGQVQVVDLDANGRSELLVCDTAESQVSWIREQEGRWDEVELVPVAHPSRLRLIPGVEGAFPMLVVGSLGALRPSDELVGSVSLLIPGGAGVGEYRPVTVLAGVGRVADVGAADLDGDGDVDLAVAAYGFVTEGEVGWLECVGDLAYRYHALARRAGALNLAAADVDGDGATDLVVVYAQEHEEVVAYMNRGRGEFSERRFYKAPTPSFGFAGMQVIDLDQDGDVDVLLANGDNMDLPGMRPRPYHGIQWLENRGGLVFEYRTIVRWYGAYATAVADLDRDGDLDIVASSMFNDWSDPARASLMWLENDGRMRFTSHGVARQPIHLISVAVADLDRDGRLDLAAAGMHAFPPFDRVGRVTVWWGVGKPGRF